MFREKVKIEGETSCHAPGDQKLKALKIAFCTQSDKFESLILQLKRSGHSARATPLDSDFYDTDIIVVDLGHPGELAYPFLIKIGELPNYSDKVLLAAISHRTQIQKLRSMALGCDGYISPQIEYKEFYDKIKGILDPDKYLVSKSFSNQKIMIDLEGLLTHISETGCLIRSKISLSQEEKELQIDSPLVESLAKTQKTQFRPMKSVPSTKRSYINEISFLNLEEEDRKALRKGIKEWSTK